MLLMASVYEVRSSDYIKAEREKKATHARINQIVVACLSMDVVGDTSQGTDL